MAETGKVAFPSAGGEAEQRRQQRYQFQAEAFVERQNGEKLHASTVNLSGGGALLQLDTDSDLRIGETVTCAVRLYACKPPQSWGMGRVVRRMNSLVAIDFQPEFREISD
jgi:PilZ domain